MSLQMQSPSITPNTSYTIKKVNQNIKTVYINSRLFEFNRFKPMHRGTQRTIFGKIHGKKSGVHRQFYQVVNTRKIPHSPSIFRFGKAIGEFDVFRLWTPGKLPDNGTNTRIHRSENSWKTLDFPVGEHGKMSGKCRILRKFTMRFLIGKTPLFLPWYTACIFPRYIIALQFLPRSTGH